jgi:hypothetical protein
MTTTIRPSLATLARLTTLATLVALVACDRSRARSDRSFDEIEELVRGRTAAEVLSLLGEPDSRRVVFDADERWIWWNYTTLDGRDYPPELRGRVVHLEIVFSNPNRSHPPAGPTAEWRVADAFGVNFRMPGSGP